MPPRGGRETGAEGDDPGGELVEPTAETLAVPDEALEVNLGGRRAEERHGLRVAEEGRVRRGDQQLAAQPARVGNAGRAGEGRDGPRRHAAEESPARFPGAASLEGRAR